MIDPSLVIFAIESGIKLGRKINEVLIDQTAERPLLLPFAETFGNVETAVAREFFSERPDLIGPGGPLAGIRNSDVKLVEMYRAMKVIEAGNAPAGEPAQAQKQVADHLAKLGQFEKDFGAKHPVRRIFGTVVEIGIDYFNSHPEALGSNSAARKVIQSFASSLQDTDFAEGSGRQVLGDLLLAALHTVNESVPLLDDDERLQLLLGGITSAVAADLKAALESGAPLPRQRLFRRIGSSIIRGGTSAFVENANLFLPGDGMARTVIKDTLSQVFNGIKGQEDLFSTASIELIVKSALRATAENVEQLKGKPVIQELMTRVLGVVADKQWDKLFSAETAAEVLHEALEVARENMETLINPDNPQEQLLATALAAMAGSLSSKAVGGPGALENLLSRNQVLDLTRIVFAQVAEHPEQLLPNPNVDPKLTVLAQVVGSVAKALGEKPTLVTNGAGFIELVNVALEVTVNNADLLIDTESANSSTNMLFKLVRQVVDAVSEAGGSGLVNRTVMIELVQRILPLASANLAPLLAEQPNAVKETIATVLELATGALKGRINGDNLPQLAEQLFNRVIWDEVELTETKAVVQAAREILQLIPALR